MYLVLGVEEIFFIIIIFIFFFKLFISIFLGVWYAISDEVHQLLVPARNGNLIDVWIDSLGIATGTCVMMANYKIREIILNKKMAKAE